MHILESRLCEKTGKDILELLDDYFRHSTDGSAGLDGNVRENLINELRKNINPLIYIAYEGSRAVGEVVAFKGFSIFEACSYVYVQFIYVRPEMQRRGVARRLMAEIEERAKALGCFKINLEVREHNVSAKSLYRSLGYEVAKFGPGGDILESWEKKLARETFGDRGEAT